MRVLGLGAGFSFGYGLVSSGGCPFHIGMEAVEPACPVSAIPFEGFPWPPPSYPWQSGMGPWVVSYREPQGFSPLPVNQYWK